MSQRTRHSRWPSLAWALALVVASGCLPPQVSVVDKLCSAQHSCGSDLVCCNGRCKRNCDNPRCPDTSCELLRAVDCATSTRVCLDRCWEPCSSCNDLCVRADLQRCLDEPTGAAWFCQPGDVCLVHAAVTRGADCRAPPPQCEAVPRCACLEGPFALYPFCDAWETCLDGPGTSVTCRSNLHDAGTHPGNDAGSHPGNDAAAMDRVRLDSALGHDANRGDAAVAESGTTSDAAAYDAASASDAGAIEDGHYRDAGVALDGATESGRVDASVPRDAGASDAAHADSATSQDTGTRDSGGPDSSTPCGPMAPDCFYPVGTGPTGERCCDGTAQAASCGAMRWQCPSGYEFATRCNGFDESCMGGTAPACSAQDKCVWSWNGPHGETQCTSYGPAAPCSGGVWHCVAGTSLRSRCACIAPNCPG